MGKKKGGSSWLSAVKRAFRSPTKDNRCDKKAKREHELEEEEEKSRDGSSIADDWRDCPRSLVELESMLQDRKEASFKREKSLAHTFTQQVLDEMDVGSEEINERELEETANWLDEWMSSKQWSSSSRGSFDRRDSIKTVEMDTAKPHSNMVPNARRSQHSSPLHRQACSPRRSSHYNPQFNHQPPHPLVNQNLSKCDQPALVKANQLQTLRPYAPLAVQTV